MKIPTYKRQTAFPSQAGAQFLGVQASPAAFGAPGAALQQFGQTIGNEAQRWAGVIEQEHRKEQATQQARSENEFNKWYAEQRTNLLDDDPTNWTNARGEAISARQRGNQFEDAALLEARRIAQGISNPTVRARVLSSIRNKIYAAMPTIHSYTRDRYGDHASSEVLKYFQNVEEEIAGLRFGSDVWTRAIDTHKKAILYWASLGEWDDKYTTKQIQDSLERIDMFRYHRASSKVETPEDARLVANDLLGGVYDNIGIDRRDTLLSQAENKVRTLLTKEQNALLRGQREAAAKQAKEEEFEYNRFFKQITIGRDQLLRLAQGEQLGTGEEAVDVPTVMEIRQISERKMSVARKEKLIDAIEGRDAVQNERAIAYLEKQILESVAPQDLEALKTQIDQLYFNDRGIGAKGYDRLRQVLKDTKDGLPFVEQRKRYLTMLNRVLTKASVMGGPAGATNNSAFVDVNEIQKAGAEEFFLKQLYDGVRPHEAFYNAIDRFVIDNRQNEVWQAAINGLPRDLLAAIGGRRGPNYKISQQQITAVWQAWAERFDVKVPPAVDAEAGAEPLSIDVLGARQRRGDITQRERLNINQLYEEERILDGITEYNGLQRVMDVVQGAVSSIGAAVPELTDDQHEAAVAEAVAEIERNVEEAGGLVGNIETNFNRLLEYIAGGSDDDQPDAVELANERNSRDSE